MGRNGRIHNISIKIHVIAVCILQDLNRRMAAASIYTMASGGNAPAYRCYLHAQSQAGARLLVELLLNSAAGSANLTVKAEDLPAAQPFLALVKSVLQGF